MAFLYAILMPGEGPHRATAADTQACVGTVLRHIGSCWTLVTSQHLAGGTVNMVVFASETRGPLLWLSRSGAKESKLKEIKGEGEETQTKVLHRHREERMETCQHSHQHSYQGSDWYRVLLNCYCQTTGQKQRPHVHPRVSPTSCEACISLPDLCLSPLSFHLQNEADSTFQIDYKNQLTV